MQRDQTPLGACSECGERLLEAHLLVEYRADGDAKYYAECPECRTVVHPE